MQFPRLKARDLEGRTVEIPQGLPGVANLVVLAFEREHQEPIEEWMTHLAGLQSESPGLAVWNVPVLPRSYRIWRNAIDSGLRAGIADPSARDRVMTTYVNLRDLQKSLDLSDLSDIRLYLLDRSGVVRWQGCGAYSEPAFEALVEAVDEVVASS